MSYGRGYVFRRVCVRCKQHRPMAGGATLKNHRWICAACRAKVAS